MFFVCALMLIATRVLPPQGFWEGRPKLSSLWPEQKIAKNRLNRLDTLNRCESQKHSSDGAYMIPNGAEARKASGLEVHNVLCHGPCLVAEAKPRFQSTEALNLSRELREPKRANALRMDSGWNRIGISIVEVGKRCQFYQWVTLTNGQFKFKLWILGNIFEMQGSHRTFRKKTTKNSRGPEPFLPQKLCCLCWGKSDREIEAKHEADGHNDQCFCADLLV